MGGSVVTKGILIGLIIGLVFGFGGGYAYKNLNAEAPINSLATSNASETDNDISFAKTLLGKAVKQGISRVVTENGIQKVFGVNSVSLSPSDDKVTIANAIPQSDNLLSKVREQLLPRALAQVDPPPCTGAYRDLFEAAITQSLIDNDSDGAGPCIKSVHYHGQFSYTVSSVAGVGYDIEAKFEGQVSILKTHKSITGECYDTVVNYDTVVVRIDVRIDDSSVTKTQVLCQGFMDFDTTWANLKYDRKKCCGGVIQLQTITP